MAAATATTGTITQIPAPAVPGASTTVLAKDVLDVTAKVEALFESGRISGGAVSIESLTPIVLSVMEMVSNHPAWSGADKKAVVVAVLTQEIRSHVANATEADIAVRVLPTIIDGLYAAAQHRDVLIAEARGCWTRARAPGGACAPGGGGCGACAQPPK